MSTGMNQVILMGHLGSDPEFRMYRTGSAMLRFRMATNERYRDKNSEWQERTDWHEVVLWGARAEPLSRWLTKGSWMVVEGALRTTSYEKDGQRRYKTEVVAHDLHFAPARRHASEADESTLAMTPA